MKELQLLIELGFNILKFKFERLFRGMITLLNCQPTAPIGNIGAETKSLLGLTILFEK